MKERISLDTSFLVKLLSGNEKAIEVWKKVVDLEAEIVLSVIVLFEIKRLSLKEEKFKKERYEKLEKALLEIAEIVDLDKNLALKAAYMSHGTGLSARDAIIYTTAQETRCHKLYTADRDFLVVSKSKKVRIEIIE